MFDRHTPPFIPFSPLPGPLFPLHLTEEPVQAPGNGAGDGEEEADEAPDHWGHARAELELVRTHEDGRGENFLERKGVRRDSKF